MRFQLSFIFMMLLSFLSLSAQTQKGLASVRPLAHEGVLTKSGERFSHDSLVASHRSIPYGSIVSVTNIKNRQSVELKINDRGPFIIGRIIDLSEKAAQDIGLWHGDTAEVRIDIIRIEENFSPQTRQDIKGDFTIQVGSYGNKDNANKFATQLASTYQISNAVLNLEYINGKALYKVYIGNFKSRKAAEQYLAQLPVELQKGYVTTIKNQ